MQGFQIFASLVGIVINGVGKIEHWGFFLMPLNRPYGLLRKVYNCHNVDRAVTLVTVRLRAVHVLNWRNEPNERGLTLDKHNDNGMVSRLAPRTVLYLIP